MTAAKLIDFMITIKFTNFITFIEFINLFSILYLIKQLFSGLHLNLF